MVLNEIRTDLAPGLTLTNQMVWINGRDWIAISELCESVASVVLMFGTITSLLLNAKSVSHFD
jgi:hypothetical protein